MRASNRRVLNASARIDSQETRKVQLHCQPVSNAIPLAENLIRVGGVERIGYPGGMIALILFVLGILASPFKAKSRLEAENAALRQQLIVLRRKL